MDEEKSGLSWGSNQQWPSLCWTIENSVLSKEENLQGWGCIKPSLSHLVWNHLSTSHPKSLHAVAGWLGPGWLAGAMPHCLTACQEQAYRATSQYIQSFKMSSPYLRSPEKSLVKYLPLVVCPTTHQAQCTIYSKCSINSYLSPDLSQEASHTFQNLNSQFFIKTSYRKKFKRNTYSIKSWSSKMEIFLFICLSVDGRYLTSISALKKKKIRLRCRA